MSFSSGVFGGFGSNNQPSSGFGGFGANSNNSGGFGSTNTGGFGQNTNTDGSVFGTANSNNNTRFGSNSGGFGSNTSGGFGNKPTFGSTSTATGLFGSSNANNTTPSAFGSFGNANATSSPFSSGNANGGGLFGNNANKPSAFGTTGTTTNSLFGGGNTSSVSGFNGGGFGAANNPGLGGGVGDPPGTASTPFQAFTEKEPNSTNITNAFQNIMFQEPFRKWSAEELRLADYAQGRRHGNFSGAGAFGVSSGFGGGFGSNNQASNAFGGVTNNTNNTNGGGLFGSSNNNVAGSAFGQTGNSAFGNNTGNSTGGGLFGSNNNKPAGGLFGSNPNQQQTGGLFGNASGGGFGTAGNAFGANNGNTGGGLFGANNQANKPQGTGLSFGNANTNNASSGFGTTTGTGFGAANNTTGSGLFGNANSNQQSSGGLFGNNQQPQQQNSGSTFGGAFGAQNQNQQTGGLFGSNQQKPAGSGLFGLSTTNTSSGGLFGNAGNQQQNTGGFGTTANAPTTGGLFGAAKPNTSTGLFGATNNQKPNATGGTGLFGGLGSNIQNQQTAGSSLFGSANNAQQKSGGIFGSANQTSGTSLFGCQNSQIQGSSLFGSNTTQQQVQNPGFGNSLLGSTQQANNTPQGLTANLNDVSAYGSPSLFAGVGSGDVPDPGPLATPLNNSTKPRRISILPMYKLAPSAACRFATPQKRGFGFSYSSYGTPGVSPAGSISSTPGKLGRNLLGPITSGTLSKSMSTNNLRRSFNNEDSILAPGAFSSNSGARWYGNTGSKKLVINRDIRSDLFSTPQKKKQTTDGSSSPRKLAKRVSFDTSNVEAENGNPLRNVLPASEGTSESQASESTPRQSKAMVVVNGSKTPEMEHIKGNELAVVHEEDNFATPVAIEACGLDNTPGDYWTKPSTEELLDMNRMQRQRIDCFTAGRDNVGYITFKVPVDLSGVEIEDLCGDIIRLESRSATVYPVASRKPPVGKGLNVPARIVLEQSWPRGVRDRRAANDPKRLSKHVERLKRIPDTAFEDYNQETGTWTFSVEHFTTYGLDDDSTDDDLDSEALQTQTGITSDNHEGTSKEASVDPPVQDSAQDDPAIMRHGQAMPGTFDRQIQLEGAYVTDEQPFLGPSSADPTSTNVKLSLDDDYDSEIDDGYDMSEDEDTTRSSFGQHRAAEQDDTSSENEQDAKKAIPGGILRARMRAMKDSAGPLQLEVAHGDDWMEMLQKSVSPVKRDRQLLKEINESPSKLNAAHLSFVQSDDLGKPLDSGESPSKRRRGNGLLSKSQLVLDKGHGFATSIDLMNSLFEKPNPSWQNSCTPVPTKGFPQWPYERQDKQLTIDESERAFRHAPRATWGPGETLIVIRSTEDARSGQPRRDNLGLLTFQRLGIQSRLQDVRIAKFSAAPSKQYLRAQDGMTDICVIDDAPKAILRVTRLKDMFQRNSSNLASAHEKSVWELASILFDRFDTTDSDEAEKKARKTMLSHFWTDLVEAASTTNIGLASTNEEKVVACLAGHRTIEACKYLAEGKDFRLGTIVPLVGLSDSSKQELKEQLKAWHDAKILSEFTVATRTIYELLSGNVCVCNGMKGVPVEDRLDTFVISKKFGLDWRQAFGLRLWYATVQHEGIAEAVSKFKEDIEQDREDLPQPWFTEQGIRPVWDDTNSTSRQDLLWGLLQLYSDEHVDLETVLSPENSQLSPLEARLSWQLGLALVSTGKISFGVNGTIKADALTIAYAAQLTAAHEWLEAVFVLLHLHDTTARTKAIKEHLCRHAGRLMGDSGGVALATLTERLRIPAPWLWEAQALYMRSVKKDPSAEVQCLLWAGSVVEAHRVFVQQVAPRAVIERDYETLSDLMAEFEGRQNAIVEWALGGEVYNNFLTLEQHRGRGDSVPPLLLERLMAGLKAMSDSVCESEFMRFAAVSDMADETAREVLKLAKMKQDVELRSRILNLPLTQDRLLAYSVDLGRDCYREVMSH